MIRAIVGVFIVVACVVVGSASTARALDVTTPPTPLPDAPLLISGYFISGSTPKYLELYNDSDEAIKANEWAFTFEWSAEATAPPSTMVRSPLTLPISTDEMYIPPHGYIVVSFAGSVTDSSVTVDADIVEPNTFVSSIHTNNANFTPYQKTFDEPQTEPMQLNPTTTGYTSTGKYSVDTRSSLYDTKFYQPLSSFPLVPHEIVANPRTCSPLETDESCKEYVEFYNDTDAPISFNGTRLRIGYQGSNGTSVALGGVVNPGDYAVFDSDESGDALSITNSGGFVWLEDTYGVITYDNTVIEYASASSATHKGQSWSLIDDTWQWGETTPNAMNEALPEENESASTAARQLTPCRDDQYRNPATNRCKLIASSSSSLKPCAANQYRSPETNRCRLLSTSSNSLKPCVSNQYRNPATNRCKLLASTANSLKPCTENQERNPETNRCRGVVKGVSDTAFAVEPVKDSAEAFVGWWALGGLGVLAVGYGMWEWRSEVASAIRRTGQFFTSH